MRRLCKYTVIEKEIYAPFYEKHTEVVGWLIQIVVSGYDTFYFVEIGGGKIVRLCANYTTLRLLPKEESEERGPGDEIESISGS